MYIVIPKPEYANKARRVPIFNYIKISNLNYKTFRHDLNDGSFNDILVILATLMSSPLQLLQHTAASLLRQGKTPSLALFKARLGNQLNGPELFAAYQQWRQLPSTEQAVAGNYIDIAMPATEAATSAQQAQLNRIEAKLDQLLALLQQKQEQPDVPG